MASISSILSIWLGETKMANGGTELRNWRGASADFQGSSEREQKGNTKRALRGHGPVNELRKSRVY